MKKADRQYKLYSLCNLYHVAKSKTNLALPDKPPGDDEQPFKSSKHEILTLSKVITDLGSCHRSLQHCAVLALAKYLRIPQNVRKVLQETNVVTLAVKVYMGFKEDMQIYAQEIDEMLNIFYCLSTHAQGAEELQKYNDLMQIWYKAILNRKNNVELISRILRNLSHNWKVVASLEYNSNALTHLADIFECYVWYPDALWLHLSHFLKRYPHRGVQKNFIEILYDRVRKSPKTCHERVYQCLGHMLRVKTGLPFFRKIDGLQWLYTLICDEVFDNYEYILYAIMQALQHKRITRNCCRLIYMPDLMLFLAEETENENVQAYCLKSLRQMGNEMAVKSFLLKERYRSILCVKCLNEENQVVRNELCAWLKSDRSTDMMRALLELDVKEAGREDLGLDLSSEDSQSRANVTSSDSSRSWSYSP